MKRALHLGVCTAAALAGLFVPASAAQASTTTTTAATTTTDYVCASWALKAGYLGIGGLYAEYRDCTGPTDPVFENRTITVTGSPLPFGGNTAVCGKGTYSVRESGEAVLQCR